MDFQITTRHDSEAGAGLDRLGLGDRISERIDAARLLPAVCQGVLALQTRDVL